MTAAGLPGALAGLARTPAPPSAQEVTVTALRIDGRINGVDSWGGHVIGIPALDTYQDRAVGDRVLVADVSGAPHVIGRIGPDPVYAGPAVQPVEGASFLSSGDRTGGEDVTRQGAPDRDGAPLQAAYFYGTALSTAAAGASTVRVWIARDPILHGSFGPQVARLFLHAATTPPATGFTELGAYAPLLVPLEVGEVRVVQIPEAWRAALAAGTARGFGSGDASGLRVSYIRLVDPSGGYTTT
ncbi:hypothetical protein ACIBSV_46705 [Embleya sp. NPDC050154]|uniref:hypothetical protein n=1 Tax=Embleya sp. NPDC050154 TaxID=3363988 RepID=UPI0037B8E27E